jgi:hypothetical protein
MKTKAFILASVSIFGFDQQGNEAQCMEAARQAKQLARPNWRRPFLNALPANPSAMG